MNKPRVLIVEDEPDMRETIAEVIKDEYDPILAADGRTGLDLLKKGGIDVILLDIRLPDINGLEVLSEAKKHDSNIEVVLVTAYPDVRNAVEATKLGAFDYISKPFHNQDLLHTIRRAHANLVNHREIERLKAIVTMTLDKIIKKEKQYTHLIQTARGGDRMVSVEDLEELWSLLLTYKEELLMVTEGFERRENIFQKFKPISIRPDQMLEGPQ